MQPTQALIHLDNLRYNLQLMQSRLEDAAGRRSHPDDGSQATGADEATASAGRNRPRICFSVKANGYGHGALRIAQTALEEGIEYLAVARVQEGAALRGGGITSPIFVYSLVLPEEIDELVRLELTPFVADRDYARRISEAALRRNTVVGVHLKVDTGMGRLGCRPEELPALAEEISGLRGLRLDGVATHFPAADSADASFTEEQMRLFRRAVAETRSRGLDPGLLHAANSGAVVHYPETWEDIVRPGILGYGYYPSTEQSRPVPVRPVMEFQSSLVYIKQVLAGTPISYGVTYRTERSTWIGTVAAGYADGFNRGLSNGFRVLLHESGGSDGGPEDGDGRRPEPRLVPVVGRVCMDQFMVDLGPEPRARRFDRVTLFGPDPAGPSAEDVALRLGTIPYEVTCGVSARVPRVYTDSSAPESAEAGSAQAEGSSEQRAAGASAGKPRGAQD
jgi:alanine racemase